MNIRLDDEIFQNNLNTRKKTNERMMKYQANMN